MPSSNTLVTGDKLIRRQLGRAATLKRFQNSHKLASEEEDGGVQKLMQPTIFENTIFENKLVGARVLVAVAQYVLQWFSDPATEREYRYFAYIPRVKRLANIIIVFAFGYALTISLDAIATAMAEDSADVISIAVRLCVAVAAAIGAYTPLPLRPSKPSPLPSPPPFRVSHLGASHMYAPTPRSRHVDSVHARLAAPMHLRRRRNPDHWRPVTKLSHRR